MNWLNEKVDLPCLLEEEEKKGFWYVVNFFLSRYGLQEGMRKDPEEVLDDILHELKICAIESEAHGENSHDKEERLIEK